MDEVLFRSSQRIENLQLQAELAASKTKDFLILYSGQTKLLVLRLWNNAISEEIRNNFKQVSSKIISNAKELQHRIFILLNPKEIYLKLVNIFGKRLTKRDICFCSVGFLVGGIIGFGLGLACRKKEPVLRYMRAVQCSQYLGIESVIVAEDAKAPYKCGEYDVLVNVKAASVQIIDTHICVGYGRTLRKILQRVTKQSDSDLPVTLGRDCTGIVVDIGSKVTRLELGDEVWLTVPFWSQGTLSQVVLVPETRVSKKPKNVGFEGACSLPYPGSLALSALAEAHINSTNAKYKRILVQGGCSPVGCILIQLLKHWKAAVTTTCYTRSLPVVRALGTSEIILQPELPLNGSFLSSENKELMKMSILTELEEKGETFDVIINTTSEVDFSKYCRRNGAIISTLPQILTSDSFSFFGRSMLSLYIRLKYYFNNTFNLPMTDFDETHLCYVTLDRLSEYVEDGYIQTVVDKVFKPHDIEIALNHVQTSQSIGSTIVTFR